MLGQALSLLGAGVVLVAYAMNQMGRLDQRAYPYLLLNLIGGGILTFFAVRARDPGLMLMEGSWVVISLAGIFFAARRMRK
ncbi:MAG: hypothetical protein LC796_03490 [Acidobacteria bacterium]|nr:hypothetical protein [Acidobacteriota bacterium]MCA1611455.1 hypothetical protein [Acidobacteriota bacterium]